MNYQEIILGADVSRNDVCLMVGLAASATLVENFAIERKVRQESIYLVVLASLSWIGLDVESFLVIMTLGVLVLIYSYILLEALSNKRELYYEHSLLKNLLASILLLGMGFDKYFIAALIVIGVLINIYYVKFIKNYSN